MADIFLSYAKSDRRLAEQAVAALKAASFTVWWDDDITPHGSWDATIERELNAAKAVLVLWTPDSVNSEFVRAEANWAKGQDKLVPAQFVPCTLPIAFSLVQTANLVGWGGRADHPEWQRVLRWLKSYGGGEVSPEPVEPKLPDQVTPRPEPIQIKAAGASRLIWPAAIAAVLVTGVLLLFQAGLLGGEARPVYVDAVDAGAPRCNALDARAFADRSVPDTCFRCPVGMTRTTAAVTSNAACSKPGGNGSFAAIKVGDHGPGIGNCPGGFMDLTVKGCWSCRGGTRTVHHITSGQACVGARPPVTAPAETSGRPVCADGAFRTPTSKTCLACPPGAVKTEAGLCQIAPA